MSGLEKKSYITSTKKKRDVLTSYTHNEINNTFIYNVQEHRVNISAHSFSEK